MSSRLPLLSMGMLWLACGPSALETATVEQDVRRDRTPPTSGVLSAQPGDGHARLTWTPATDNIGIAAYQPHKNGAYVTSLAANTLSWTAGELTNGQPYEFKVVSVDRAGNRTSSNTVAVTPTATATTSVAPSGDMTPPTAATLSAAPRDGQVVLCLASTAPATEPVPTS